MMEGNARIWSWHRKHVLKNLEPEKEIGFLYVNLKLYIEDIFYAVNKEDDPALEAYVPFRILSKYLINKGFGGVAYKSTRMELAGLKGKCLTLFNPEDAIYVQGEMEVYEYHKEGCTFLKKY